MYDEKSAETLAAEDLSRGLDEGRARAGLNQTQLAQRAGLARATVNQALSTNGPVPSVDTVTALARVLKLPLAELLVLRRDAKGEKDPAAAMASGALGRPIGQWEPHELEVHPAGPGASPSPDAPKARALPGYVSRTHDQVLADAVRNAAAGCSRIVVLVGTSSTGKTRACWEAVQPLAQEGWRLWHPFDPTRAEAALADLNRVGPRTVVWLNEAQHYLGDRAVGERIAAAVHRLLLEQERGPVLVLGTLWPEYAHQYTALPAPGGPDPHSRVRELLAGRTQTVPDAFDTEALSRAAALADQGDQLLAGALTRAYDGGRVTQDLAGAPELLRRYEQASPPARALLEAAMDARYLVVGPHLSQAFLTDAAPDYLSQHDYDQLTDDWAELAYAELAEPVHGKQAPLRRTTPRPPRRPSAPTSPFVPAPPSAGSLVRLADYLEQHGRTARRSLCPPATFWHAAHTHLTDPADLSALARAAGERHRLQWAHHLWQRAAELGDTSIPPQPAVPQRKVPYGEVENSLQQAAARGSTIALTQLAALREEAGDQEGAERFHRQAVDHGDDHALIRLARLREKAGDRDGAESLLQQAVDHGNTFAMGHLAAIREKSGNREGAEALARQAADHDNGAALTYLARVREDVGDRNGAESLLRQAGDRGDIHAHARLAQLRELVGDREGAEALAERATSRGHAFALIQLARLREEAGNRAAAEDLVQRAADHGDTDALPYLARLRDEAGDRAAAENLLQQAAERGNTYAHVRLAVMREEAGDAVGAETLALRAADLRDTRGLTRLGELREEAGDREGAEAMARHAADHGSISFLVHLIQTREATGDHDRAEGMARHIADRGCPLQLSELAELRTDVFFKLWPYGLDPDGTPTPPWQPPGASVPR
ncbi:helix-turn-helix domain-containing protein [Streptomyces sp. NPDC056517]|uniref:helix-turn-helix domain-containing protein n=1 Tax=Streptomyces sp. NPDC056517 TaxID=3345848 RepID=UPI0036B420E2